MGKRLAGLLVVLMVAACGQNAAELPVNAAPDDPVWVEPGCPETFPMLPGTEKRGGIPADFGTVSVLRCRTETRDVPGQGQWSVRITEKAETPATDLMAQLRRPSEARTEGACTLEMVTPPYFVLIDGAGKAILPRVPADRCGKPSAAALAALDALPFKPVSETLVRQARSQQSMDTGCPEAWKDELALEPHRPGPAVRLWPDPSEPVRICVYGDIANGAGKLISGRSVSAGTLSALDNAGPAAECRTPRTRFAVLMHSAQSRAVVELDGCHRLMRPDRTLGQLDAATAAAVAQ